MSRLPLTAIYRVMPPDAVPYRGLFRRWPDVMAVANFDGDRYEIREAGPFDVVVYREPGADLQVKIHRKLEADE